VKRRQALAGSGAVAIGSVTLARTARAAPSLTDNTPDYVTRSYDEDLLEKYQPMLDLSATDETPTITGYVARSADHDTTTLNYWAMYTHQDGISTSDSHFGDSEPVVLEVDEEAEEIVSLYYDGYHWFVARSSSPPVHTTEGGMHPTLWVQGDYHFYTQTTKEQMGTNSDLLGVTEWTDAEIQGKLDNGWPIDIRTLTVPWSLSAKADWWGDEIGGGAVGRLLQRTYLMLGWQGADDADEDALAT